LKNNENAKIYDERKRAFFKKLYVFAKTREEKPMVWLKFEKTGRRI